MLARFLSLEHHKHMKKTILTFLLGVACGAIPVGLKGLNFSENRFFVGRNQGEVDAARKIQEKIKEKLGRDFTPEETQSSVYSVKDVNIFVVDRNGIKTLRAN